MNVFVNFEILKVGLFKSLEHFWVEIMILKSLTVNRLWQAANRYPLKEFLETKGVPFMASS